MTQGPRDAFAAALVALRRRLPDVSDEALARRASGTVLPSGRRVTVNARRLGEWCAGRSVPRDFHQVVAVVLAVAAADPRVPPQIERWRELWRAAREHRPPAPSSPAPANSPTADLVIGRPPTDAAALRPRPALAAAVDAALADGAVARVVLSGPGGAGKSQAAAAAFHRARGRGGVYVWVPAATRESILAVYARAWRAVGGGAEPPDRTGYGHDEETQADLFVAWLRAAPRAWLVVLDDVDDPVALDGLWPAGSRGRSIVTTRRRDATVLRPGARLVAVGMFDPAESVGYLRERLGDPGGDDDLAALAGTLGHLPLALAQAAAYLIDSGTTVAAYRRLVDDRRERLADLLPASSPADGHERTVVTTWRLAAQRAGLLADPPAVERVLRLLAMLAPAGVPETVLYTGPARAWIGGTARDALRAVRALHRLSLVDHGDGTVAMHALVQRAVRESVPDPGPVTRAAADALEAAWAAEPDRGAHPGGVEGPGVGRTEAAHPAALYASVEALRRVGGEHLWRGGMHPVLRRLGDHLAALGRPAAAREVAAELLDRARRELGETHRDTLFLRGQVARARGELGDPAGAYRDLAALRRTAESVLPAADADVLALRLHEARERYETGAVPDALRDLEALVADAAAALGPGHAVTLAARGHAALCRGLSGDAAGARDACAALCAELTERLGPRHLDALNAVADLGRWIGESGDAEGAVDSYLRAVEGLRETAGRLHHDTLTARHNLAYWRGLAGQGPLAVAEFASAADDAERALGARHPTTLTFRANLAYWRGLAGDPVSGRTALAGLRPVIDDVFGEAHPRALRTRRQHAELHALAGDTAAAAEELTAALARMRQVYGDDDPRTREATDLLAAWR